MSSIRGKRHCTSCHVSQKSALRMSSLPPPKPASLAVHFPLDSFCHTCCCSWPSNPDCNEASETTCVFQPPNLACKLDDKNKQTNNNKNKNRLTREQITVYADNGGVPSKRVTQKVGRIGDYRNLNRDGRGPATEVDT